MNRRDFLSIPLEAEVNSSNEERESPIVTTRAAGYPRDYQRHTWVLVESARAWLCRDDLGFYAVDAACPHLGSLARPDDEGFACPCHGSVFSERGEAVSGPARRPLRHLLVDLDAEGRLVIRRDQEVTPDDRLIA
jgi:cytochrome b6-f complex iron-sulfur subunit